MLTIGFIAVDFPPLRVPRPAREPGVISYPVFIKAQEAPANGRGAVLI
tara:strand:+ start:4959 stop:5102 length:144 start_codon:yes stop_codon:yes gene_type:complete